MLVTNNQRSTHFEQMNRLIESYTFEDIAFSNQINIIVHLKQERKHFRTLAIIG